MTELKRPERYLQPESIKPKLSSITDFYTQKINEYWNRVKQLNEYADALENEISVLLKETPKVEVLLDDMPKPLVVVPQIVSDAIESIPDYCSAYGAIEFIDMKLTESQLENEDWKYVYDWIFADGNADKFVKAWIDGYTVEKEKLFYLKNVMTNNYLIQHKLDFRFGESDSKEDSPHWQTKFNQSEIDGMETGSYEQIEVEP